MFFHVHQDKHNLRCPNCRSSQVIRKGKRTRTFRSLPIGSRLSFVVWPHQRIYCQECHVTRYVDIKFAEFRRSYTRAFKRYASSLLRISTIQDVAKLLGVGWDLMKEIDTSDLKRYKNPPLKELKRIAIDEISFGKGHTYITVVLDIASGAIVFIGEGKGSDNLDPFWKKLKSSKATIEAVATDL